MNRRSLPAPTREAIASSAEFLDWVEERALEAQRRRDDRLQVISSKRTEISRSLSDHQAFQIKLEEEIDELEKQVADDDNIIQRAEQALTMDRPTPKLTTRETPVTDKLEEQ